MDLAGFEPDAQVEIKYRQVIERDVSIPAPKDIHILLVDDGRVAEPYLGIRQQIKVARDLVLPEQSFVIGRVRSHLLGNDRPPAVGANRVLVNVRENVRLVPPTVDVKVVELAHKGVVSARLRGVLRVEVDPLVLEGFVLSQIVEVVPSLSGVAAKEEDAVFECEAVGA